MEKRLPDSGYEQTFLYKLLMLPQYRICRHMLLILCVMIISAEQIVSMYNDGFEELGVFVYLVSFGCLITYLLAGYINFFILFPRYLLRKKFGKYITALLILTFFIILIQYVQEYYFHHTFNLIPKEVSYLYEGSVSYLFLQQMLLIPLSLIGFSMAKMLKYWILEDQQVKELEKNRLRTEVEKLKEQINPGFLFNVLNKTGNLDLEELGKASEIIILLSRILRYQLYDGENQRVLLSSEIQFLVNYLKLEQLYSGKISYKILQEGDLLYTFIPPLILFPFVQHTVKKIRNTNQEEMIRIFLIRKENELIFRINSFDKNDPADQVFSDQNHRLEILFGKGYTCRFIKNNEPGNGWIELKISL